MRIKSTEHAAQRLWRIDKNRLQPGDILLERSPTLKSAIIRSATRGDYSHALIWMGDADFMEAVGDGVRPMPFARIFTTDPDRWTLLRLVDNEAAAKAAATYSRDHPFKGYNLSGALTSILPRRGPARATTLFCSQLVAAAYQSAGVNLVPGKQPFRITPADLQTSPELREAPNPFEEIVDPEERAACMLFVDRDEAFKGSPIDQERIASQEAFAAVADLVATIPKPAAPRPEFSPASLGDLLNLLASEVSPEGTSCAEQLLRELEQRQYFDLLIPTVGDLAAFLRSQITLLESGTLPEAEAAAIFSRLDALADGWSETEQRYKYNGDTCWEAFLRSRRQLFQRLATMHLRNAMAFDYLRTILDRSPAYQAHRTRLRG